MANRGLRFVGNQHPSGLQFYEPGMGARDYSADEVADLRAQGKDVDRIAQGQAYAWDDAVREMAPKPKAAKPKPAAQPKAAPAPAPVVAPAPVGAADPEPTQG